MPCKKCSNGKWQLGSGKCMFTSKKKCEKAERGARAAGKIKD